MRARDSGHPVLPRREGVPRAGTPRRSSGRPTPPSRWARGRAPRPPAAIAAPPPTPAVGPTGSAPDAGPLILERYRLKRRLGAGAFGTVWQARDERLHREVAVKLLPRERIAGGRFEREARAAARLAHPAIVTLYEAAVDDEGAYLVSELVRGPTLDRLLADGELSDIGIARIGLALCDALLHAHAQGVVHRDVKPSNVLVPRRPTTPEGVAKLTDFGVARVIGGNPLTRTGDVLGTAAYMAPEQAEGRLVDGAADLYSLALVLYEALTGVNPLASAPRTRRLGTYLPPLRRQRRELPRELGQAIDQALRPRPRERGTIEELRVALERSLPALDDRPGTVDAPRLRRPATPAEPQDEAAAPEKPRAPAPALPAWSLRALSGATAAGLVLWISTALLPHPPLAPGVAALTAALLTAALPRLGWLTVTVGATAAPRPPAPPRRRATHRDRRDGPGAAVAKIAVGLAAPDPRPRARRSRTGRRLARAGGSGQDGAAPRRPRRERMADRGPGRRTRRTSRSTRSRRRPRRATGSTRSRRAPPTS